MNSTKPKHDPRADEANVNEVIAKGAMPVLDWGTEQTKSIDRPLRAGGGADRVGVSLSSSESLGD